MTNQLPAKNGHTCLVLNIYPSPTNVICVYCVPAEIKIVCFDAN